MKSGILICSVAISGIGSLTVRFVQALKSLANFSASSSDSKRGALGPIPGRLGSTKTMYAVTGKAINDFQYRLKVAGINP